ncbi:hypothetical protein FZI91_17220 [Mycobacterium sp. CBMA271]|nr:hypothetical protein [Mycobacteroides sp. CBMA 271]
MDAPSTPSSKVPRRPAQGGCPNPAAGPLALVCSVLLGRLLGLLTVTMRHPPDTVDQRISCPDATSNQNDMSGTPSHANSGG